MKEISASRAPLPWDIASLIDLEILNTQDKDQDENLLHQRDRAIYLDSAKQTEFVLPEREDQSMMFRYWVEMRRREKEFPDPGPGETVDAFISTAKWMGFVMCLVIGWMLTWATLAISGKHINAWLFWLIFILVPLGFTLLGAWWLIRPPPANGPKRILLNLLVHILVRIRNLAAAGLHRRLKRNQEDWLWTLFGKTKRSLYGRKQIFLLALESLAHFLGLGLVIGIFLAILTFKSFSEPGQGYKLPTQAAIFSGARVHSIVRALSLPWGWFHGEGQGYPSLEQIKTAEAKNQEAFEVWSSFFLWSSLVYGVLPRLGLWVAGRIRLRRAITSGGYAKFDALWRRMTEGVVVIAHPEEPEVPTDPRVPTSPSPAKPATSAQKRKSVLLVPGHLNNPELVESVRRQLQSERLAFEKTEALPSLPKERALFVESLANLSGGSPARVLVLQQAFMPPNQAFERFVQEGLRGKLGNDVPVHIILIHEPEAPQAAEHLDAWRNRLDRGDPLIQIHTITQEPKKQTTAHEHS